MVSPRAQEGGGVMSQMGAVKVGLYARGSTAEQTTENQILALRAHAQQRGWEIAKEFVDDGVSGAKESRPALDKLMKAAWAGKFQTVLVWRFDRFARSTKHLVTALDTFRSLGVAFISLTEQVDTSTPIGQAMFTIISAMAQLERDVIRERVKLGLARARANGVRLGPPRVEVDVTLSPRPCTDTSPLPTAPLPRPPGAVRWRREGRGGRGGSGGTAGGGCDVGRLR